MDLTKTKPVIINACIGGGWYPKGSERLARSLNNHGWAGEIRQWIDQWPNDLFPVDSHYNIKASAFFQAMSEGYTHILWADCSVWALADPMPIFDIIDEKGYFMWGSGYNCAQTCNDYALNFFKLTRDEAEKIPDCSSGIMGFNVQSEIGFQFLMAFFEACKMGVFHGSRFHDNQSSDPRFLFHRQDQSAASLIAGNMGLQLMDHNSLLGFYRKPLPKSWIFTLRGI
jgi:hypothetical protein